MQKDQNLHFMNLPSEYAIFDSFFHIIPVAFEGNVTYGKGAAKGPEAIISSAQHLEYYDEECKNEPFEKGIFLHEYVSANSERECIAKIVEVVMTIGQINTFPLMLGGDHSTTIGMVAGIAQNTSEPFDIIVLDAHSDFRDSWNNSPVNHACVSKQLVKNHTVFVAGVRSQDADEAQAIANEPRMRVLHMHNFTFEAFQEQLNSLSKNVYLSIDVDCFDPSFIKNTGTPEPGGFTYREVQDMLRIIFAQKNVIAADIVEFAPNEHYEAESYSLARLAYKIMAYKVAN